MEIGKINPIHSAPIRSIRARNDRIENLVWINPSSDWLSLITLVEKNNWTQLGPIDPISKISMMFLKWAQSNQLGPIIFFYKGRIGNLILIYVDGFKLDWSGMNRIKSDWFLNDFHQMIYKTLFGLVRKHISE